MFKRLSVVFLLFLPLISCNNYVQRTIIHKTEKIKFPTKSFVKIYKTLNINSCKTNENCKVGTFHSVGSGISIGQVGTSSIILTAGHVCRVEFAESFLRSVNEYSVTLRTQNILGYAANSEIVNVVNNNTTDLCMLLANNLDTKGIKLSAKIPEPGDVIYSMAAPSGIFHPPTVPLLQGIYSGEISPTTSLITLNVTFGASGSGILNSDMELVGILFATHPSYKSATLTSNHKTTLKFVHESFKKLKFMELK